MRLRIFCDFDGTIALKDVGDQLFIQFSDEAHWWRLVDDWRQKKIDGRELWRRQAERARITPAQMDAFAAAQAIDATFPVFVDFCRQNHFPVYVLSDGMDAYIERILKAHGLADVEVRANHLEMTGDGKLTVQFPYYEENCGQCANCKGAHIRRERLAGESAVFIGDGYSDLCALKETNILFAKDDLARYCKEKKLPYQPYRTFADVQQAFIRKINEGKT